ncbi:MAG: bifunctional demethylmenaquinone methyltransferase/2-methoxy-6-polyprenyl-1,4-benzoquinol methylase UbiE [Prevotellaceae bacterium]|jgi:demethylmenaquinone methyltransferase/2-methoxy-6-polyprenyl-1,4-benzoquinol methylase|nr:bifunctional demethylmenaquinone methyltransferase/2-methoxy-6-polyprenyl-1,4-benzoquinol methylase UbiE [Prevotellaceae bacterium]
MAKENFDCENVLPYGNNDENKQRQIARMFDAISGRYDLFNRLMSLGIDRSWRRKALKALASVKTGALLDVATGTGDFAIEAYKILRPQKIIGVDISEGMLKVGREKVQKLGLPITFEQQDGERLGFANETFDAVTIAFGIRNFEQLSAGLREMNRVLKRGGKLAILELSEPEHFPAKQGYVFYSRVLIPALGRFFSKDKQAYSYLPQSIKAFPQKEEMTKLLLACGFSRVEVKTFTFGTCSFYLATK